MRHVGIFLVALEKSLGTLCTAAISALNEDSEGLRALDLPKKLRHRLILKMVGLVSECDTDIGQPN